MPVMFLGATIITGAIAWWLVLPSDTAKDLVKPSPFSYVARLGRTLAARPILWLMSWPHALERLVRGTPPEATPSTVIWNDGPAELRRYTREGGRPVLIVHSLVSSAALLDLTPTRSLVRHLRESGFDVFLLDWGRPGKADCNDGFEQYVARLIQAERVAMNASGSDHLQLIGYCAGATLALMRLGAKPHPSIRSFAALAPPVDMEAPAPGGMRVVLGADWLKPILALDHRGCVPGQLIREAFHILKPKALATVRELLRHRRDPMFVSEYLALSRWTWNQPAVPGAAFFDLVDMFRANSLQAGTMKLGRDPVVLSSIRLPTFVAVASRDHIVPTGSSLSLDGRLGGSVETMICQTGHVAMITGDRGRTQLWPRLVGWLEDRAK